MGRGTHDLNIGRNRPDIIMGRGTRDIILGRYIHGIRTMILWLGLMITRRSPNDGLLLSVSCLGFWKGHCRGDRSCNGSTMGVHFYNIPKNQNVFRCDGKWLSASPKLSENKPCMPGPYLDCLLWVELIPTLADWRWLKWFRWGCGSNVLILLHVTSSVTATSKGFFSCVPSA